VQVVQTPCPFASGAARALPSRMANETTTGAALEGRVVAEAAETPPEERMHEALREAVRARPFIAILAAAGLGATLGGLVFSRLGRLVFLAAAGFVAAELWSREGALDTRELLARLGQMQTRTRPTRTGGAS
jgi:hypothetical protein